MAIERENRAHPRFDLLAQVQITRDSEVYIMSTRNISRGGLFIMGDPADYPDLRVGTQVELVIFNPNDPDQEDVSVQALVVRREQRAGDKAGFGLQFMNLGRAGASGLDRLLAAL